MSEEGKLPEIGTNEGQPMSGEPVDDGMIQNGIQSQNSFNGQRASRS